MPRVRKGAARNKARRRLLKAARGYRGTRSKHKQQAKITLTRAGVFAYRDRRARRRDFLRLWITRLSAACRIRGTRYSRFIHGLQQAGVLLNRKMLSQLAIEDPKLFDQLTKMAEVGLNGGATKAPIRKTASKPKSKPKTEAEPQPDAAPTA